GPAGRFGPDGALTPRTVERALDDLKLVEKKKETAKAAVKACEENVGKLVDLARADLLLKGSEGLDDKQLATFKEALDRQPRAGRGGPRRAADPVQGETGETESTMTTTRRRGLLLCCLGLLLVPAAEPGTGRDDQPRPTKLRVLLPSKRAQVLVDGKPAGDESK